MKNLINQIINGIAGFSVIVLLLLPAQASAADNPEQLIKEAQVRLTEIPTYTVPVTTQFTGTVYQSLTSMDPNSETVYQSLKSTDSNAGNKAFVKEVKGVSDKYHLRHERGKKSKIEPIVKTAMSAQGTMTVEEKQPPVRVSFDESEFYEQVISQFKITSTDKVALDGKQHNKIIAINESGRMQVTMWIDAINKYLTKYSLQVNGETVVELNCSYRLEKTKFWVPQSIVVKEIKQNETTVLNYGTYTFAEGSN